MIEEEIAIKLLKSKKKKKKTVVLRQWLREQN